jgi:muconolactone delta-isomerase
MPAWVACSARLAREEALGEIVRVPEIEIADLGTFDADDPKELSTQHPESPGVAWRHHDFSDLDHRGPGGFQYGHVGLFH